MTAATAWALSNAGMIQARGNRMRFADLSSLILQDVTFATVEHTNLPAKDRRRMSARA